MLSNAAAHVGDDGQLRVADPYCVCVRAFEEFGSELFEDGVDEGCVCAADIVAAVEHEHFNYGLGTWHS